MHETLRLARNFPRSHTAKKQEAGCKSMWSDWFQSTPRRQRTAYTTYGNRFQTADGRPDRGGDHARLLAVPALGVTLSHRYSCSEPVQVFGALTRHLTGWGGPSGQQSSRSLEGGGGHERDDTVEKGTISGWQVLGEHQKRFVAVSPTNLLKVTTMYQVLGLRVRPRLCQQAHCRVRNFNRYAAKLLFIPA